MRRQIARWFNSKGIEKAESESREQALRCYALASFFDPTWSVPVYNKGLQFKYSGKWEQSLRFNRRAVELDSDDESSWWNLAIAATALHDWAEARRAWSCLGIEVPDGEGEWIGPPVTACARLNPNDRPEVVWGERLDPVRFVILNIPLPESGHRFRDIVLNDGAQNGSRTREGVEVPVFDELELWRASPLATYQVALQVPSDDCESRLVDLCDEKGFGIEDWSTIRWLCRECSQGNPGPHECKAGDPENPWRPFAIAADNHNVLKSVLDDWVAACEGAACRDLELLVPAG